MNYDYISSYKIARNCDVVFSEVVTPNQFIRLDIKSNTNCLTTFKSNNLLGLLVLFSLIIGKF